MKYVLDTHVLIWWLLDERRLKRTHGRVLDRNEKTGDQVGLSAISLWEVAKLVERGRIRLRQTLDECLNQIERSPLVAVLPITGRIAAESTRLGASYPRDPVDQIIGATARCHGLTLMTEDERILGARAISVL